MATVAGAREPSTSGPWPTAAGPRADRELVGLGGGPTDPRADGEIRGEGRRHAGMGAGSVLASADVEGTILRLPRGA